MGAVDEAEAVSTICRTSSFHSGEARGPGLRWNCFPRQPDIRMVPRVALPVESGSAAQFGGRAV